jgi:hypothetical protein
MTLHDHLYDQHCTTRTNGQPGNPSRVFRGTGRQVPTACNLFFFFFHIVLSSGRNLTQSADRNMTYFNIRNYTVLFFQISSDSDFYF